MKKIKLIAFIFITSTLVASAQKIPDIKLEDLEGNSLNTGMFNDENKEMTVLAFWATWCIPCIHELSTINDNLSDWKKKYRFNFYAISEDDSRTINRVKPLADGKNWDFSVILDKNQDLKRELNIMNVPYTLIIKGGKIIWRHSGYVLGDDEALLKVLKDNQ